jgi:mono/diheme cytochrome c family protein
MADWSKKGEGGAKMKTLFGTISALFLGALALFGCSKAQDSEAAPPATAGKTIFESKDCGNCHGPGKRAPQLTKLGAEHDAAWIVAHVKNPKTHNPNSGMPGYEGKMSESDLQAIGSYLASLK